MVQSKAPTVDAYLADASPQWATQMRRVRDMARSQLKDHEERMHWGMPAYLYGERVSFGFAAQKHYLSLYFHAPGVFVRNASALSGVSRGKACLRFRKTMTIDWSLLEQLLADAREQAGLENHEGPDR